MAPLSKLLVLVLGVIVGSSLIEYSVAQSDSIDPEVQKRIDDFITAWYLPSSNISKLGLSIVRDNGEILYSTGFGLADQDKGIPNGNRTQFLIGSTSKSFTATVVIKVLSELFPDLGEAVLDTPIKKLIPSVNFTLIDRFRSEYATFRDLLAHRMCLFRDDLQLMAEPFTNISEIVYRQRYSEEICGMRAEFQYNNQMFVIAGELIGILANKTYTELLNNLLEDIGMSDSAMTSYSDDFPNMPNRAQPYYVMNNESYPINPDMVKRVVPSNAAGGLYATPNDMVKYMRFHMNKGNIDGKQIIPEKVLEWMTKPSISAPAVPFKSTDADIVASTYGYGLGLMLASYDGWQYIHHGGYMPPYRSLMSLFPSQKLGIFTSGNEGPVMVDSMVLHAAIFEILRGTSNVNEKVGKFWNALDAIEKEKKMKKEKVLKELLEEGARKWKTQTRNPSDLVGKYGSGGSGDLEIIEKFNNRTDTNGTYVMYGKWYHGWLENFGGSIYKITWDSDVVQDNYASGDSSGFGYARAENDTFEFLAPVADDYVMIGKFKLGVSLDILPPIPYAPDSCGPEP